MPQPVYAVTQSGIATIHAFQMSFRKALGLLLGVSIRFAENHTEKKEDSRETP